MNFDQREQHLLRNREKFAAQQDPQAVQGQMVGGVYVPPNALQVIAQGLRSFGGMRGEQLATEELNDLRTEKQQARSSEMKALTDALRGTPADEQLPEGEAGPVRPAQAGSMEAFYRRAAESQMPEFQDMGIQGQIQQAQAEQQKVQRQQMMQAVAVMTPQEAIAQGIDPALVKAYHEGKNIGRDEVTWQNTGNQLVPVTKFGDTPEGIKAQMLQMSPEGRDASARGWASVQQGQQRLSMEAANGGTKAPTGYRFTADGSLQAIPGGPADLSATEGGKPLTEGQAKGSLYLGQMRSATRELGELPPASPVATAATGTTYTNWAAPANAQKTAQLQNQWAEAFLRAKTGAAATKPEVDLNVRTFFPVVGDSKDVIAQKTMMRKQAERDMEQVAGRGAATAGAPDKTPKLGAGGRLPTDIQSLLNKYGG